MKTVSRLVSLLLVVAVAGAGIPAPLAAGAASESGVSREPDLYQAPLKAPPAGERRYEGAYAAGAAVVSAFSMPGRVFTCGLGSALSIATLLLTFGSGYGAATSVFKEGCIGKWVITDDDMREASERKGIKPDPYLDN